MPIRRRGPTGTIVIETGDVESFVFANVMVADLPSEGLNEAAVVGAALTNWVKEVAREGKTLFVESCFTWEDPPAFVIDGPHLARGDLSVYVGLRDPYTPNEGEEPTPSQLYTWVDHGTPEHPIIPTGRSAYKVVTSKGTLAVPYLGTPRLVFKVPYKASTVPGQITSRYSAEGNRTIKSDGLIHPGVEPRGFSDQIGDIMQSRMDSGVQAVIDDALDSLTAGQRISDVAKKITTGLSRFFVRSKDRDLED